MLLHEGKVASGLSESRNSLSLPGVTLWKAFSSAAPGSLFAEQDDVHELKFLQEFENQVTQFHPQRFIVVADDVRGVLLNLNEGFCLLEEYDVALGCVLHLHVTETVLDVVLGREMLLQLGKTGRDERLGHREGGEGRMATK